ncbi:hypothetical protein N9878_02715, partial [bacterium]|nr:hypothetical protein [bacterium]
MSDASNLLTSLIYGFGIIGNNESYNKRSKVTEEPQEYYFRNLVNGGGAVAGIGKGTSNSFVTGVSTCAFDSIDSKTIIFNNNNTSFLFTDAVQTFTVTHEFNINPFYLAGQLSNLQDLVAPELYREESLKYAYDVDFRTNLSNPNRSIKATFEEEKGSVGWLNQNFNGFDNEYEVESIVYADAVTTDVSEGLILNGSTKATITVARIGGVLALGQRAGVYISYLPDSEDEYIDTASTQTDNFLLDYLYHTEGDAADTGTGIIKSIDSSIVADKLVIEVVFDYAISQRERLTRDSNYLITVEIADSALSAGDSNRVIVIADVNTYQQGAFIEGLTTFTDFRYLVYGQTFGEGELTIAEAWDEDGILVEGTFDLDLANNAVLQSVQFELVSHNPITGDYFRLDSYIINTGGSIVSDGVQQIQIDTSRNYNNIAFEDFNTVSITTGSKVGDIQTYSFLFGQKLTWQDWIANPNVNALFFDNTKPNNNLNYKASNYSNVNGYEIKVLATANSTGLDELGRAGTGLDLFFGGEISVNNYGITSTSETGVVTTKDPATLTDLNGAVLSGTPTLIESRFQNTNGLNSNQLIIHRYQPTNSPSNSIAEVEAVISLDGADLVGSSIIQSSLFEGSAQNFTARYYDPFQVFSFAFQTTHNNSVDPPFNPTLSGIGSSVTWKFGGDEVTGSNPNYSGTYLDGSLKTVT